MNTHVDPVQAALAQAQAAADNMTQTSVVPATAPAPVVAAAPAMAPQRASLDDLEAQSMAVDAFIKVALTGIQIDKVGFHENLVVGIDLDQCQAVWAVSYGSPVKYFTSVDRVTATRGGGRWADILQKAGTDPKPGAEYMTVQIPMEVLEEATDVKGNKVEAGKMIGFTPSVTGVADFAAMRKAAKAAGWTRVKVKLGYRQKTNTHGTWALLTYEPVGEWA